MNYRINYFGFSEDRGQTPKGWFGAKADAQIHSVIIRLIALLIKS